MTYIQIIAMILLIWLIASKFIPAKGVKQITGEELKTQLHHEDKQYIDVRTPKEYDHGHVDGFINIPLKKIRRNRHLIEEDKEIIVMCHTGIRSMDACKRLKRYGFKNLTNVKNGLYDFQ